MKRLSTCVLGGALLVSPLAAQLPPSSPATPSAPLSATASRPLYLAVAAEELAGRRLLVLEVRLDGALEIRETFYLDTASGPGNTFELLAGRPDLRSRLLQAVADRSRRVEARLSLDGKPLRGLASVQDLVRASRKIERAGISQWPKVKSTLLDLGGSGVGFGASPRGTYPIPPVSTSVPRTRRSAGSTTAAAPAAASAIGV
jgi:hypothetical protein